MPDLMSSPPPPGESAKASSKPAPAKARRRWIWVAAGLALVLVGGGVLFFRQLAKPPATAASPRLMITAATALKGDIGIYINARGVATPLNTVAVKSRVDGQLVKVNYQEGQTIHIGDPLAEIDPAPFQAALVQAEGQFARDQALLENARLDFDRYREALEQNAIPKQRLDTQAATVHQYEGIVKIDQGQVDNATVQLAYCRLTAPISGRLGLRLVDAGNIVPASDANPLLVITELQPITVIFNVAEDYLPQIQLQLRAGKQLAVEAFDRAQTKKLATAATP